MMDCAISVSHGDGNLIDYNRTIETATFANAAAGMKCCECGDPIQDGEEFEHVSATTEDGDDFDCVTCMDCARIAGALSEVRWHNTFWDDMEDEGGFENFTHACLLKIPTASAKQKLVERWRKWKGLR